MYWVGKFPMADKIPRTLKGFCKSTHEKLKFFTTWDNNSSQKKKKQQKQQQLPQQHCCLSFLFPGPLEGFPRSQDLSAQKGQKFQRLGEKKKQQIHWELNVGKHASFFEPCKEITPVVLFVHGHSQELSSDCISLQPRGSFSTDFQQRRQSQK